MKLAPGAARHGKFITRNPYTGALANADATPTVAVERNGSAVAPAITVTNVTTGEYRYSYVVDAGYAADDSIAEIISATVAGLAGKEARSFMVDSTIASRAIPGSAMTLTGGERTAIATAAKDAMEASGHASGLPAIKGAVDDVPNNNEFNARTLAQADYATSTSTGTILSTLASVLNRLPAALVGGRMAANAEVVGDKTGYSISGTLTTLDAIWTKIVKIVRAMLRSDAATATDSAAELTEINADAGSGAGDYANQTDSQEAIRDRGDAAWADTGAGGDATQAKQDQLIALFQQGIPAVGPGQQRGHYRFVRGDAYGTGARLDLTITKQANASWPDDLDDYTWSIAARKHPDNSESGEAFAGDVEVVTATGASRAVRIAASSTETGAAAIGKHLFAIRGVNADSPAETWTIVLGTLEGEDSYTE